jgi:hypothetical protein
MKYIVFGAILCVCVFAETANTQIETGTIVVLVTSKDKVALAADSRATLGNGRHEDQFCKILALGNNLIFAATGVGVLSTPSLPANLRFDVRDELRLAYESPPDPRFPDSGFTIGVINGWWERIQYRFMNAVRWLQQNAPEELAGLRDSNMPQDSFVLGIFAGVEPSGDLITRAPVFKYGKINRGWLKIDHDFPYLTGMATPRASDPMQEAAFSYNEVANRYIYGQTPEAQSERRSWNDMLIRNPAIGIGYVAVRIVDLDIAFYPAPGNRYIGGRIDAVVLKRGGGIEWVQRKEGCPAN